MEKFHPTAAFYFSKATLQVFDSSQHPHLDFALKAAHTPLRLTGHAVAT